MEEKAVVVECEFLEWTEMLETKLTKARFDRIDRKEYSEEQWNMFKELYPIWYEGRLPIHKSALDLKAQNVTEQGLFAENTDRITAKPTENKIGMDFDNLSSETNNEEDNEQE